MLKYGLYNSYSTNTNAYCLPKYWIMSLMVLILPNYNVKSLLLVWFTHRSKVYNMLIKYELQAEDHIYSYE